MLLRSCNEVESHYEISCIIIVSLQKGSFLILQMYIKVPPQIMQIYVGLYVFICIEHTLGFFVSQRNHFLADRLFLLCGFF